MPSEKVLEAFQIVAGKAWEGRPAPVPGKPGLEVLIRRDQLWLRKTGIRDRL
jgi:hypothetical protein